MQNVSLFSVLRRELLDVSIVCCCCCYCPISFLSFPSVSLRFLQLWFSSRLLSHPNFHQYFPIIFPSCVFVCRPSIHRKNIEDESQSEIEALLLRMKSRINIEWNVLGGHSRRWLLGGKKNVNFNSRDSENVMVMPLEIEVLHTKLERRREKDVKIVRVNLKGANEEDKVWFYLT